MAQKKVQQRQIDSAQQAWIAPTLVNSWVNYGSGFNDAGYMKDSMGFVHLKGLVRSGSGVIFNLPAGYRPGASWYGIGANGGGSPYVGLVTVTTGGDVQMSSGTNAYVGLDMVTFKAEA